MLLQWVAIFVVLGGCAVVLSALPRRTGDALSRQELQHWMAAIGDSKVRWLVRLNIAGTLVSFATVILFFIGNASIFGIATCAAILSLLVGALVTARLSRALTNQDRIKSLMSSDDPSGATIAAVLWTDDKWGKSVSTLVKWVSIANLFGVLWLEFAFMADMGGRLMHLSPVERCALLFLTSWAVLFTCLRFGVRGIAFLDFLLTPLIFAGVLSLLVGAIFFLPNVAATPAPGALVELLKPDVPSWVVWLFVAHVLCLNPFLIVVTEGHWFRRWAFGEPELRQQVPGLFVVVVISCLLVAVGLLAGYYLPGEPGDALIGRLLASLEDKLVFFAAAFWIAGIAALFSTADVQILGLVFTVGFRPSEGKASLENWIIKQPALSATALAVLLVVVYFLIRIVLKLEFEKLVFIVLPAAISLLPLFVLKLRYRTWKAWHYWLTVAGLLGYGCISMAGLIRPAEQLQLNLAAILVPVFLASIVWLLPVSSKDAVK